MICLHHYHLETRVKYLDMKWYEFGILLQNNPFGNGNWMEVGMKQNEEYSMY